MPHLISIPILAFFWGILAALMRSKLALPIAISKFISLYLLFSIGFKGGVELSHSSWSIDVLTTLIAGLGMALLTPVYVFFLTKNKLSLPNAGAVAASYGSISIVTFITALSYLQNKGIPYGGHMIALMALMEFPAIIMGLLLIRLYDSTLVRYRYGHLIKDSLGNGPVIMLLGGLLMGYCSQPNEVKSLELFFVGLQKGMLVFFLLDMGLQVGKNITKIRNAGLFMVVLGITIPLINATIGIALAIWLRIDIGNSLLLVVLLASASYIAVPAAFQVAMPSAEPSIYVSTALAITFPFNIAIGLPLYIYILEKLANF